MVKQNTKQTKNIDPKNIDPKNIDQNLNTNLFNLYNAYYKHRFFITNKSSLIDDIDPSDQSDTNRALEFIFQSIYETKEYLKKHSIINVYEHSKNNDRLINMKLFYILSIDGKYTKICELLHPLMIYLSKQSNLEKLDWKIITSKSD